MIDGERFTGRSYADVVRAMSQEKLVKPHSLASYRRATAKRVEDTYEVEVDASTDRSFVSSLCQAGLMRRVA